MLWYLLIDSLPLASRVRPGAPKGLIHTLLESPTSVRGPLIYESSASARISIWLLAVVCRASDTLRNTDGATTAASVAMMAMTTSNSINVKPVRMRLSGGNTFGSITQRTPRRWKDCRHFARDQRRQ